MVAASGLEMPDRRSTRPTVAHRMRASRPRLHGRHSGRPSEPILPGGGVAAVDLRQPRDAGKHVVAARLLGGVPLQVARQQGAGPEQDSCLPSARSTAAEARPDSSCASADRPASDEAHPCSPPCSSITRMVRNLTSVNGRPPKPGRTCRKRSDAPWSATPRPPPPPSKAPWPLSAEPATVRSTATFTSRRHPRCRWIPVSCCVTPD